MYLKSIELSGFKSFAKKSELLFSSSISAIVGPNGSGKSNIAEAFRFVLGEQSIKSLRGKKGEDLIWNGAGDLPRANRASVKIIFDNRDKFLPIDFEDVVVERVVHRDSVNEYLINGSQVRLKDVVELLAAAHIGASGHHIISQGEADRILGASIKERKEMIEDALGLKMYQYKKQESQRKLEKTSENIAQTESLRREILPHIKFLKKQVEKAEKTLQMREELQTRALEYLKREDEYIKHKTAEIAEKKSPLEKTEAKLKNELAEAKQILENAKYRDGASDRLISLESELRTARQKKDELLRESGRLDGEIISLSRMIKKQEEIASSYLHKTVTLVSVEALYQNINQKIASAKNLPKGNSFGKECAEILIEKIEEIDRLILEFIDSNKDKVDTTLLGEAQKELTVLGDDKKMVAEQMQKVSEMEGRLSAEYAGLQEKINKEKDSGRDAEKTVFRIMAEEQEVHSELRALAVEEESLKLVCEDFKRELTELSMMLGTAVLHFQSQEDAISATDDSDSATSASGRTAQEDRRRAIEKIKIRLEDSGGTGGADVLKEYTEVSERDAFLEKELADLKNSAESLSELIADLENRLSTEFKTGVEKINTQFREYFALMFGGGEARLSVINAPKRKKRESDDLLSTTDEEISVEMEEATETEEGIDIEVNLPKKKIKGLVMLSGGERALTSIALLFAISQVNPPPFIILDETDAALDEANSKKYADMIENLSKFSQLIVITHNRETMSRAGILYGVTMGLGGGSKLLSVAFDEAVAVAK
jgi:chromosome segregation protein